MTKENDKEFYLNLERLLEKTSFEDIQESSDPQGNQKYNLYRILVNYSQQKMEFNDQNQIIKSQQQNELVEQQNEKNTQNNQIQAFEVAESQVQNIHSDNQKNQSGNETVLKDVKQTLSTKVDIVLEQVLKNQSFSFEIFNDFTKQELKLIYYFCLRKMKKQPKNFQNNKNLNNKVILQKLTLETIKQFYKFRFKKTFQHNFKFLFKNSINFLKELLEKQNKISITESTNLTLRYYFGPEDNILLQNLEFIMNPRKQICIHQKIKRFKEFGNKFLTLIFTNKNFKIDFLKFVQTKFKDIYSNLYSQRIFSLRKQIFKKLKKQNLNSVTNEKYLQCLDNSMEDYLIKRQQCKLPWSINEIQQAIEDLKSRMRVLDLL